MKHQKFDHYQRLVSSFSAKPKDIFVYYSLSGSQIVFLTKSYKGKRGICANMVILYTFENIGRILTGL